jgi:hypothetical protein
MISKKLLKIQTLSLLLTTLFITNSCSDLFNNPLKDKETGNEISALLLDANFFDTRLTFHFVDNETGEYIEDTEIKVFFAGKSAEHIVDYEGGKNDSYLVTNGRLNLTFDPNIEVSETNPIEFTVYTDVDDFSYDAFPSEVFYTSKGDYDKNINMIYFGNAKSASLKSATLNPGWEPFDVKFNGSIIQPENDPVWAFNTNTYKQQDKVYYSIYRTNNPPNGILSSENFTRDLQLFSNWGLEGVYFKNSKAINYSLTNDDIATEEGTSNYKAYSAVQLNNYSKCYSGIDITVSSSNNTTGSAVFTYKLIIDDETILEERISGSNMPFTVNTGAFYYPSDASSASLEFTGDSQYDISPQQINLSDICGEKVDIIAEAKDGLVAHKIIAKIKCPGQPVAYAPTINGRYRLKNSNDKWTFFKFNEGITTLMMKPNETYTIIGDLTDNKVEFDLPTNIDKIDEVVEQAKKDIDEIEDLKCTITKQSDGTVVIDVLFTFKEGDCPF